MEKNEKGSIDPKKAEAMVNLYRASNGKHPKGDLTKAVWFDLKKIKDMIAEIERTSKPEEDPGIRFYFATYHEPKPYTTTDGRDVDHIYRNTLIMVSTKKGPGGINEDYGVAKLYDAENQGELCPEECGGTDRWGQGGR